MRAQNFFRIFEGMDKDYIVTWFYREGADDYSYYPQVGGRGDSPLLHSVYMQIQLPFFHTFARNNPKSPLLFFSNLRKEELPPYLNDLFDNLKPNGVEVITLPYTCRPPRHWYKAWANQFYLYDILKYMGGRMGDRDTVTVCDADCLCRRPLRQLFDEVRAKGSALYSVCEDTEHKREARINGTLLSEMEDIYADCYGEGLGREMKYYGGEFVCLRGDVVRRLNEALPQLWKYNFSLPDGTPRLNEEAHVLSVLAARLNICNEGAGRYVKRLWTGHLYRNVKEGDVQKAVWHLPSEKKTGLFLLYRRIRRRGGLDPEPVFWEKAERWCGMTMGGWKKRALDLLVKLARRTVWRRS